MPAIAPIRRMLFATAACGACVGVIPIGSRADDWAFAQEDEFILVVFITETREVNGVEQRVTRGELASPEAALSKLIFGRRPKLMTQQELSSEFDSELVRLSLPGGISPEFRERFQEAGHGDIARFWADYELVVVQFMKSDRSVDALKKLVAASAHLEKRYSAGLPGADSLYAEVLRSAVTEEQFTELNIDQSRAANEQKTTNRLALYSHVNGRYQPVE